MASEEQVLVIERKVFEKVGPFNGLAFDVDRCLGEIFAPSVRDSFLAQKPKLTPLISS